MMRKQFFYYFCLFFFTLSFSHPLFAQNIPGLENFSSNEKEPPPPTPLYLDQSSWKYFDVEGQKLYQRIEKEKQILKAVESKLSEESLKEAKPLIKRILINLDALPRVRAQISKEIQVTDKIRKSYSIQQLIELYREYLKVKQKLAEAKQDVKQIEQVIDNSQKHIDNLIVEYNALTDNTKEKLLQGLKIMANKAALSVSLEKLRILQNKEQALESLLNQIKNALSSGKKNIIANHFNPNEYQRKIKEKEKLLVNISQTLISLESRLLGDVKAFEENPVKSRFLDLEILKSRAKKALIKTQIIFLKIEMTIQSIISDKNTSDLEEIQNLLAKTRFELNQLQTALNEWLTFLETEISEINQHIPEINESEKSDINLEQYKKERQLALETLSSLQTLNKLLKETLFLSEVLDTQILIRIPIHTKWYFQISGIFKETWFYLTDWADDTLFRIGDVPITPQGIFQAIIVFIIFLLLSALTQLIFHRIATRQKRLAKATIYNIGRLFHYFFIFLGIIFAFSSLGFSFKNLAIIAGALSVGIGFGLQAIVNNFFSGLIILFEKSLKVGDFIKLESGLLGTVSEIRVRSTLVRTNDGIEVIIPNSEIIQTRLVNFTMTDKFRRIHVPFSVSYKSDKEIVRKAALEAALRVPHTIQDHPSYPNPQVWLVEFGESSLNFELVTWVDAFASKRQVSIIATYLWEIHTSLKEYNIEIPFPQRDLHIKSMPKTEKKLP